MARKSDYIVDYYDNQVVYNTLEDVHQYDNNTSVCGPIDSLKELYDTVRRSPAWTKNTIPLTRRCDYVIKNSVGDCHVRESDYVPKPRISRNVAPKTLICHDMMGGYKWDKYVDGVNEGNGFTFHRWAQSDIFCYFSHHFITVPTLPWINLAHSRGTAVIGTIITEHTNGQMLCEEILKNGEYVKFADALVEICVIYKFDGWLLNFENAVSRPGALLEFVKYLTERIHQRIPGSYIIWYDSVLRDGKLMWQNELNEQNKCYFDVCDGIFLNYGWNEAKMKKSKEIAGDRARDVFVGIDVWGRGSYGGGRFNSYRAAKVIDELRMSMAIFAHGWVYEAASKEPERDFLNRYYSRCSLFWKLLWPYTYTTPILRYFETFFKTGVTSRHYDLKLQEVQPSYFPAHALTADTSAVDVSKIICGCFQERLVFDERLLLISNVGIDEIDVVHRLFSTHIKLTARTRIDVYTYAYEHCITEYELILLAADNTNNKTVKIVCNAKQTGSDDDAKKVVAPLRKFKDEITSSDIPRYWDHRRYILTYANYELLEIGIKLLGDNYLYLCGFAINEE